uniref:Fe2OG dioxygenase domain-containing protein n=1 Tax=Tetradesmus obliquus TaxID=3088 RepID=A0A383WCP4_TETOB|eukprot:jgi/Sobl393_1/2403/SZX75003.1
MAEGPYEHAEEASSLSETAFRNAEKKYQLHMQQRLKKRKNGRVRGGKLVAQPTDLSDVIDVRARGSSDGITVHTLQCTLPPVLQPHWSTASVIEQHNNQQQQQQCCGSSSVTALTFQSHPGLAVFPAALPLQLQLQLMRGAVAEWPEPPTRTNHTAAYGMQLRGLFDAAQAGLSLQQQLGVQQSPQQQRQQQEEQHVDGHHHQQQQQQQQIEQQQQQEIDQQQQQQHIEQQQQQHCQHPCRAGSTTAPGQCAAACSGCSSCCRAGSPASSTPPTAAAQQCGRGSSSSTVWAAGGSGPQASMLLRKLRWASLGPPYNWTLRVYEPHEPHTLLPSELVQLAEHFAALAARACSSSRSGSSGGGSRDSGAADADAAASPGSTPAAAAAAVFRPNVALVNYYHPGDTLNGHKDDVERDLLQPIVTMSLGCAAVFLMGGPSRQQQPTALLLRSGDVAVLGGPARACYHGVPRVLGSWEGVTNDVTDSVSSTVISGSSASGTCGEVQGELHKAVEVLGQAEYAAVLRHMQQCRVNISVRSSL